MCDKHNEAHRYECLKCHAKEYQPCKRPDGKEWTVTFAHKERKALFRIMKDYHNDG